MGRLGGVLMTIIGVGVLMIGARPAYDIVYEVANSTVGFTTMESYVWQFAPIAIPIAAVIGGIIVMSRRRTNDRDRGYTEWK